MLLFVGWCLLFVLCWPVALLALVLAPLVWLLSLPLRLLGITLEAVFALLRALLFLPARLLGELVKDDAIPDKLPAWLEFAGLAQRLDQPALSERMVADVVKRFTAKIPLGRLANIEDVVGTTVYLCSSAADYLTGQSINISGGRLM